MLYKNYSFQNKIGHFPFLINYPSKIENYDDERFNPIYKALEDYCTSSLGDNFETSKSKGLIISSINPINTGSLLIPIALEYGITYCNALELVTREQKDPDNMTFMNNPILIIDEVGAEDSRVQWIMEKIINHRFKGGYTTLFGLATHWNLMNSIYKPNTVGKIFAMSVLRLNLPKSRLVIAKNDDYRYELEQD